MLALVAGCLPSELGGGGDAGADLGAAGIDWKTPFEEKVAPILGGADGKSGSCGACHASTGPGMGPGFLIPDPDMLTSLLASPGIIGATPESSRLYAKGQHEGPGLTPAQRPIVGDWIKLYNQALAASADGGVAKPTIAPFVPKMGDNTIDLSTLDPQLAGQKITFKANLLGTAIELSSITVVTAPMMGVHVVHPLFVSWDDQMNPTPDPVDSFSNLDQTIFASQSEPLGPGRLVLQGYQMGDKLNVVFSLIAPKTGSADAGSVTGCKNVALFTQVAQPTLAANCASCHDGPGLTGPNIMQGVTNLSAATQATACQGVRGEIDVNTPANSRIYTYTDPNSGIGHPFKFGAKSSFADGWIAAEK